MHTIEECLYRFCRNNIDLNMGASNCSTLAHYLRLVGVALGPDMPFTKRNYGPNMHANDLASILVSC